MQLRSRSAGCSRLRSVLLGLAQLGYRDGQRDQSEARPRRRGAGVIPAGDHALPVSEAAHAASRAAVRLASDLACPSRMA
jgi:hypothetical protein